MPSALQYYSCGFLFLWRVYSNRALLNKITNISKCVINTYFIWRLSGQPWAELPKSASQQYGSLHYLTEVTTQNDITQLCLALSLSLSHLLWCTVIYFPRCSKFSHIFLLLFINLAVNWNSTSLWTFERDSVRATNQIRQQINTRACTHAKKCSVHTHPCMRAHVHIYTTFGEFWLDFY